VFILRLYQVLPTGGEKKMFGRHFDLQDEIFSKVGVVD
jgi:hypothetical protein